MFTGIVVGTGEILDVTEREDGRRLRIDDRVLPDDLDRGDSVSVAGVCLTVEEQGENWFETFLAAETVDRTYLGQLTSGDEVNLEPALAASDRLDGHVVQGHVDTTTELRSLEQVGEDWVYEWAIPEGYGRYLVEKGSVALNGISLTIADRNEASFTTAIIPETREVTALSEMEPGDPAHLEVDVLAKYVERMVSEDAVAAYEQR